MIKLVITDSIPFVSNSICNGSILVSNDVEESVDRRPSKLSILVKSGRAPLNLNYKKQRKNENQKKKGAVQVVEGQKTGESSQVNAMQGQKKGKGRNQEKGKRQTQKTTRGGSIRCV